MISNRFVIAALAAVVVACSKGEQSKDESHEVTADAAEVWRWPSSQVAQLTQQAEAGDITSARSLYDYYSAHSDKSNVDRWESWLIKREVPEALGTRASRRFSQALRMDDRNPQKVALLREAAALDARARNSPLSKQNEDAPTDTTFAERISEELARISRLEQ